MESGVVLSLEGSAARVEFRENDSCSSCGAKLLCNPTGGGKRQVLARNTASASVGDSVQVVEGENALLKVSALQYGIPLAGFLLGTFFAYGSNWKVSFAPQELVYFSAGLIGLFFGGLISYIWAGRIAAGGNLAFEVTRIITAKHT